MSLSDFYECTPRDTYNFVLAGKEKSESDIEQMYDYTRRIMWASVAAMQGGGKYKYSDFIKLKRDGSNNEELTPFQKQEIEKLSKEWDNEMGL